MEVDDYLLFEGMEEDLHIKDSDDEDDEEEENTTRHGFDKIKKKIKTDNYS